MSQGALAHSWNQPNPPGRHSTATPIHNANTPNINETHPSPLLPGLYLRCRSGRHRPGNMAGKEEEGIISCTSWRETSVAHMLYTRLPSAVPPPRPNNIFCGSHLIFTHNTELRNWGWGTKQRLKSHSLPSESFPPAWDRFLHQTVHPLPGTCVLQSQPVLVSPQGWKSSDPSSGVMAFFLLHV